MYNLKKAITRLENLLEALNGAREEYAMAVQLSIDSSASIDEKLAVSVALVETTIITSHEISQALNELKLHAEELFGDD